ncbi:unnamed protein product [Rotaria sp. Silwood2]|nr:unnamed protein product [Rotaria sp. Silwood2]
MKNQISTDWNNLKKNRFDVDSNVISSVLSETTHNGSSITIDRNEDTTTIDLNAGFAEIENSPIKNQNFPSNSLNITQVTNDQVRQFILSKHPSLKRHRIPSTQSNKRLSTSSCNKTKMMLFHEDEIQVNEATANEFGIVRKQRISIELCCWLRKLLVQGIIVPMAEIKINYKNIFCQRNRKVPSSTLLGSAIRARLELKFGQQIVFYRRSKSGGLYVAINDLSLVLNQLMSINSQERTQLHRVENNKNEITETIRCEAMFDVIQFLRESIESYADYFLMLSKNRLSLVDYNSTMYWQCIPLPLKNFIGMLTMSKRKLNEMKRHYDFYSFLNKDMFFNDQKKLKISSISYDVINAINERYITPKHYLLSNEIFRHEKSAQLLRITNRLGHSCSYQTMSRLQFEAAEKVKVLSDVLKQRKQSSCGIKHEFAVKVADNFDMNKDTLHGQNSLHMLNQIIIQTSD